MLEVLAGIARDHRIATSTPRVQADRQMLQVFLDSGFESKRRLGAASFSRALAGVGDTF